MCHTGLNHPGRGGRPEVDRSLSMTLGVRAVAADVEPEVAGERE
jgi:hypothetical protein